MVCNCKVINFSKMGSDMGFLVPVEAEKDIPFKIKRIYYISDVPNDVTRGFHSHRYLEQVLICVSGSVKILVNTPFEEEVVELNQSDKGLYIGHMVWREMFEFSEDAVLLVLASEYYSEDDYIRDYNDYKNEAVKYFER
ncbi:sugar 3,4-ketoisomerase [Aminipila terrae]|uniref:WxcM-like domain-containing protein n=1 Tax=Aminipila terrae TaxID=2697030 RepID=A0A6P1MBP9_9FIRM|nr:FdtA/QdtA family cupin domain-containing protein [Aminipila terrae]QHI72060.1 WxcM-like domain-containing protein [Aminipila terrae]